MLEGGSTSASPAHGYAFGSSEGIAPCEELRRLEETLELPGELSEYHFAIQNDTHLSVPCATASRLDLLNIAYKVAADLLERRRGERGATHTGHPGQRRVSRPDPHAHGRALHRGRRGDRGPVGGDL